MPPRHDFLERLLSPRVAGAFTLLRVVAGLAFAFHGLQKIFGVLADHTTRFGTQIWFGGLIELVTGLAIAVGALTAWAAFLASGTMAVAYAQFHWRFSFGERFWPAINDGELSLLYAVLFLFIACHGPGPWSVDARRGRR